jgi:malonyl CoA-acyl carrier protein transacylase
MWHNLAMDSDPVATVRTALTTHQRASKRADETLAALHAAIAEAAAQGVRQNELVKVTGYTRERIRQICRTADTATADQRKTTD